MVDKNLPLDRIEAGADYLRALRSLGLEPEGLMWVQYSHRPGWILLLITNMYDTGGPLALTKLLFKAYNASVLPQNIDPFNVDAYSPDQELSQLLFKISGENSMTEFGHFGQSGRDHGKDVFFDLGDVLIPGAGVYIWEPKRKVSTEHRIRNWHRFKNRVEALAA